MKLWDEKEAFFHHVVDYGFKEIRQRAEEKCKEEIKIDAEIK